MIAFRDCVWKMTHKKQIHKTKEKNKKHNNELIFNKGPVLPHDAVSMPWLPEVISVLLDSLPSES